MALVDYSDSESENGPSPAPSPPKPSSTPKTTGAFQKATPGKIKIELPSIIPEPGEANNAGADGPPTKRARTGGGGFNALLPAPKQTARSAPKAGISLKTSSEAAFSRHPPPKPADNYEHAETATAGGTGEVEQQATTSTAPPAEPEFVGKPTRFLPLSVSSKKKKKPVAKPPPVARTRDSPNSGQHSAMAKAVTEKVANDIEHVPKPKRSLFSVQQEYDPAPIKSTKTTDYEPMMAKDGRAYLPDELVQPEITQQAPPVVNPNSLEATVAELDLTPAQRRQLFGRSGGKDANVMRFNLDNEYAANEQMRQAGEVVEHRAVKAIAPGKHSLQQLVNNARTQQDAMEDKWAEGRRNRGEGGAKYGWSG